jgi:hypothetical protein
VRDADALAVCCPTAQGAGDAQALPAPGLGTRGWRLSVADTPMRHPRAGVDRFGLNSRQSPAPQRARRGWKRLRQPSRGAAPRLRQQLHGRWRTHVGSPTAAPIDAMHPLIRGWSQDCRAGAASEVVTDLDPCMGARAQRDMPRRHPRHPGWWSTAPDRGRTPGARRDRGVFQGQARHAPRRTCAWTRTVRPRLVPTPDAPEDPPRQDDGRQRSTPPGRRRIATGDSPGANKGDAPAVTRLSTMARGSTATTWCLSPRGVRTTPPPCGSSMPPAIASVTAPAPLLGSVDGVRRVPGDRSARFCGQEVVSPPPPSRRTGRATRAGYCQIKRVAGTISARCGILPA